MILLIQITKKQSHTIHKKFKNLKFVISKSVKYRFLPEYILFTHTDDDIIALEQLIFAYGLLTETDEIVKIKNKLKYDLNKKKNPNQFKKNNYNNNYKGNSNYRKQNNQKNKI